MDSRELQADLDLALRLADLADEITMSRFRRSDLEVETKSDLTPVTEADKSCEVMLRTRLAENRPQDSVLGEEFGDQGTGSRHWILDPIDGTKNYLRGVPIWCTLIALTVGQTVAASTPIVGVVSAPALGRRWWAAQTLGAYTSDIDGSTRRIHTSAVTEISHASFSFSDAVGWEQRASGALNLLTQTCWRTRAYGDFLSHVLVAEGAVDIAAEPYLAPWDMAALVPIVTEAGGRLTGYDGSPALSHGSALSTNRVLHQPLVEILSK